MYQLLRSQLSNEVDRATDHTFNSSNHQSFSKWISISHHISLHAHRVSSSPDKFCWTCSDVPHIL